ncbi:serine--tRNA ligase [Plakobranchus ocellatus]|uniref:Serine--tRNA ligase n=1 Tax=Plakobranchus ocellatus TaxID=259542 RepID=A0AAV3Y4B1_9GAST|nr:serine--tRNA ligase [Plakobranchus ocellatus]
MLIRKSNIMKVIHPSAIEKMLTLSSNVSQSRALSLLLRKSCLDEKTNTKLWCYESKGLVHCCTTVCNKDLNLTNTLMFCKFWSHANNFTFSKTKFLHWQFKQATHHRIPVHHQPSASKHSGGVEVDDQPPSWLFVSPAVAGAYGAQVNVDLEFDKTLDGEAFQTLRANVKSRGLPLDVDRLQKNFSDLKQLQQKKAALLVQKDKLLKKFRLMKETRSSEDSGETEKQLVEQLRIVKAEITALKSTWDLEESVMLEALKLPNALHPTTPLDKAVMLQEVKSPTELAETLSHVEIARKFDLIKFSNVGPKAYYLKKELVLAEMTLTSTVCDFLRAKGYRHINGPEFVKTPIIVLTMLDPHKTAVEPMNHLTGVSQHMFAAYVAKTCIGTSVLPLKMFACGRNYRNNEADLEEQFDNNLELVWDFLKQFGFSLRLSRVASRDLRREQKRRVDFEMYSPNLCQYIPVGNVSDLGDFISRRLMVTHNQNHADIRTAKHLHMVHGTLLNITSFLALWMEHSSTDQEKFTLCHLPSVHS